MKIKSNILYFILGAIIFGSVGIGIAYQINANQISYGDTNVASAITNLYTLSQTHCPEGYHCGTNYHGGLIINVPTGATYQGIVYLDPTNLNTKCNESNFVSETGTKEGCMRFYIYDQYNSYYYAILDHNTTAMVDTDCDDNCFQKAQEVVKEDTALWIAVKYGENDVKNPRNIRATEVWEITSSTNGQTGWTTSGSNFYFSGLSSTRGQGYGWLFDRTNYNFAPCTNNGCTTIDVTTAGYWTSESKNSLEAWSVNHGGQLFANDLNFENHGVRPVITIPKS